MSTGHKEEGAAAFGAAGRRADNPYNFGTHDWTDWKDGFDQAEASAERAGRLERVAERIVEAG